MAETRKKAPRFDNFSPSSKSSSRTKSKNRAKGTKAEIVLRKTLWARGRRYRLHVRDLPGRPDLVFPGKNLVIFVDGDFWHGRNWAERRKKLETGSNSEYWLKKISYNMERDLLNTRRLQELGWTVVRLWETDVLRDPASACALVEARLQKGVKRRR